MLNIHHSVNKYYSLKQSAIVSSSVFFGLKSGSIASSTDHKIKIEIVLCMFEEVTKNGNGACIDVNYPLNLTVKKSTAKSCGVYTLSDEYVVGHFLYLIDTRDERSFFLDEVSLSLCASSIDYEQRAILRASYCNSFVSDLNITNSFTSHHSVVFRQYGETVFKRVNMNKIITNNIFFLTEIGSTSAQCLAISEINATDGVLIYLNLNTMKVYDSYIGSDYGLMLSNSHISFTSCCFPYSIPSHESVDIKGTMCSLFFEEEIISAGEIIPEIMKHFTKNINNKCNFQLLVLLYCTVK